MKRFKFALARLLAAWAIELDRQAALVVAVEEFKTSGQVVVGRKMVAGTEYLVSPVGEMWKVGRKSV